MGRQHTPMVDRGQSGTIGVVLLLAMTITGATVAVVLGAIALSGAQDQARVDSIEQAMTKVDSQAALVALGEASAQTVELPNSGDGQVDITRTGWIRVQIINTSDGSLETTVLNRSLGAIVFEHGNTTVAYQGGGVWRGSGNSSLMISKPEFHYRDGTLTLRVINVTGSPNSARITLRDAGEDTVEYPNGSAGLTNPVEDKKIRITVHSEYYHGWGSYFEERTDGGVTYDHANDEVNVTLLNPAENSEITSAMVISGGGGDFQIQSGQNSVVNSYNSSAISPTLGPPGSGSPSMTGDANITTTKDITFSGNAEVTGDLTTTGSISFSGSANFDRVGGNLRYGEGTVSSSDCNGPPSDGYVVGWCAKNASVDTRDPMNAEVQDTITTLKSDNDNADEPCFSESDAVTFNTGSCGSTVELGAGDYYTTQTLQVSGNKLLLNTTEGDIRITVDDDQSIQFLSNANVTVLGDGTVRIYGTYQFQVDGGNTLVWNAGYDAPQLWLYCTADCQVQIKNSSTFVGVVYAPSKAGASSAQVQIDGGQTEVYGAIVGGGQTQLQSNADVHFDRALKHVDPVEQPALPSISYLHVSINEIEVT